MKSLFRSRLPPPLTRDQVTRLSDECQLPSEEIQESYERFNHCYPRGYLSQAKFLFYLKQVHSQNGRDYRLTNAMVKQLFRLLDLNEDKHLNFEEFFLFNILMNQGSDEEKLRLVLGLYDRDKNKYLTRQQLESVLLSMFDLLDIPQPDDSLSQRIQTLFQRCNFTDHHSKISWNTFRTYVLEDASLFQLLLPHDAHGMRSYTEGDFVITRF